MSLQSGTTRTAAININSSDWCASSLGNWMGAIHNDNVLQSGATTTAHKAALQHTCQLCAVPSAGVYCTNLIKEAARTALMCTTFAQLATAAVLGCVRPQGTLNQSSTALHQAGGTNNSPHARGCKPCAYSYQTTPPVPIKHLLCCARLRGCWQSDQSET